MDEIITPTEVAQLLKIHVKTVYRLAEQGAIPGNRVGRSWRFNKQSVLALVAGNPARVPNPVLHPKTRRNSESPLHMRVANL